MLSLTLPLMIVMLTPLKVCSEGLHCQGGIAALTCESAVAKCGTAACNVICATYLSPADSEVSWPIADWVHRQRHRSLNFVSWEPPPTTPPPRGSAVVPMHAIKPMET